MSPYKKSLVAAVLLLLPAATITAMATGKPVPLAIGAGIFVVIQQSLFAAGMFIAKLDLFFPCLRGKEFPECAGQPLFRFDDGPDPGYTPKILNLLKKHGQKGIFFVIGSRAEKHPDLIKRIRNEGHILGNHFWSHSYGTIFYSRRKLVREIERTNNCIESITGEKPVYLCPPMGHRRPVTGKAAAQCGMQTVMWDINSRDTSRNADEMILRLTDRDLSGTILMFHDGIDRWTQPERSATVTTLETILQQLSAKDVSQNEHNPTQR